MELINRKEIECDICGNEVTIAVRFLNKLYENQDVIICNRCMSNGAELMIHHNQQNRNSYKKSRS